MSELRDLLRSGHDLQRILRPLNFAALLPTIVVTSTLSNAELEDLSSVSAWVVANFASLAIIALLFTWLSEGARSNLTPRNVNSMSLFLIGLIAALLKLASTAVLANLLIGQLSIDILLRDINSFGILIGPVVLFLVSLYIKGKDLYLSQRDLLIAHRISSTANARPTISPLSEMQQSLVLEAKRRISQLRNEIGVSKSKGDVSRHATEIRTFVEFVIRPLSHRIWKEQTKLFNDYSAWDLTTYAAVRGAYHPTIIALSVLPGALSWLIANGPLETVFASLLSILALVFGVNLIARKMGSLPKSQAIVRAVMVQVISVFGAWSIMRFHGSEVSQLESAAVLVSLLSFLPTFGWLVGIFAAGHELRGKLAEDLNSFFSVESLDNSSEKLKLRLEAQRLAQTLHSQVQNELLATAMKLEHGVKVTELDLDKHLAEMEEALDSLSTTGLPDSSVDIEAGVIATISSWSQFVEIRYELLGELDGWHSQTGQLMQVINEAVSNAIRHGRATEIRIAIFVKEDLVMEIHDNGIGPIEPKPGLGFELFREISGGDFSLREVEGGGLLRVRLANNQG